MTNNDILRRIRFIFDFNDTNMIEIFGLGGLEVAREQVIAWLKKDTDRAFQKCSDAQLAIRSAGRRHPGNSGVIEYTT